MREWQAENKFKNRYKLVLKQHKLRIKFEVFTELQKHRAIQMEHRFIMGSTQEMKICRVRANIFEAWQRYTNDSLFNKDNKRKSAAFHSYNLRRKCLSALFMHKL